jgi:hypothetical protein
MKRLVPALLMSLVITLTSLSSASAEVISFPCNGGTYSVEMPSSTLTKENGCTGNLVIDSSIKAIATSAFFRSKLTSVVIPNSVTEIGSLAFYQNWDLKSVIISNSVTKIEARTFYGSGLSSVVIPDSVVEIAFDAFFSNSDLTSIKFGKSLTKIGSAAFYGTKVSTIDIPDTVVEIGSSAFSSTQTLRSIIYCGAATANLPTSPTCPADRKAAIDAINKAASDKAAADKAAADARAAADKAAADARAAADRAAADARAAADRAATQAAQDAKKLTINCKKGSTTKRVTGESPVCPKGFTNSLDKYLTFQAYSKCKLYKKNSSIGGISLLDNGATLKFSSAGKYSSFLASAASYVDVACSLLVMKAPSFVTAQIDSTRALDGLQKATWGRLSAFWTYHPDNGLNISINSN